MPNGVDEANGAELRKHWSDGEIVEILGVIALFGYLNRWNDSMATSIEPGAVESGDKHLAGRGWSPGKHG
ncbi:MAG: carboxymuconolactone decarboxylase family protein [Terricaulis sp.]